MAPAIDLYVPCLFIKVSSTQPMVYMVIATSCFHFAIDPSHLFVYVPSVAFTGDGMSSTIFAFGYKRRRGKDLCCELAEDYLNACGVPNRRESFAKSLKDGLQAIFGLTDEQLYGPSKSVKDSYWHRTPRQLLQYFGTDVMHQAFGPDIWAKTLLARIKDYSGVVLISDLRFPVELEALAASPHTAFCIRVDRDVSHVEEIDTHPSETAFDARPAWAWDYIVKNEGCSRELLDGQVRAILKIHDF
jgi:hypothetical protein